MNPDMLPWPLVNFFVPLVKLNWGALIYLIYPLGASPTKLLQKKQVTMEWLMPHSGFFPLEHLRREIQSGKDYLIQPENNWMNAFSPGRKEGIITKLLMWLNRLLGSVSDSLKKTIPVRSSTAMSIICKTIVAVAFLMMTNQANLEYLIFTDFFHLSSSGKPFNCTQMFT